MKPQIDRHTLPPHDRAMGAKNNRMYGSNG